MTDLTDSSLHNRSSVQLVNLSSSSLAPNVSHHAAITPATLGTNVALSGNLGSNSVQSISHSRLQETLRPIMPSNVLNAFCTAHVGASNWSRISVRILSGLEKGFSNVGTLIEYGNLTTWAVPSP